MGSLIKNAGGCIAPGGAYVAGKRHLIDAVAARLSAPGLSSDAGMVDGNTMRLFFQGAWRSIAGCMRGIVAMDSSMHELHVSFPCTTCSKVFCPPFLLSYPATLSKHHCKAAACVVISFVANRPACSQPGPAGLWLAPHTTGESLKGGRLVAEVMSREGFKATPAPGLNHTPSMITAIHLGSRERMVAFCRGVQQRSPVGSYISPEPGKTSSNALQAAVTG